MWFIVGILVGILITIFGIVSGIGYVIQLLSRNDKVPSRNTFIINTPSKQQELDARLEFKPLKEGSNNAKKALARVFRKGDQPEKVENIPWTFIVLKANMLFEFPNENSELCNGVCCLDNCIVDAELKKLKKDKPIWKPSNGLILSSPTRDLMPGYSTLVLYFKTGKELEEWYYALKKSSSLSKSETIEQKRQQEYWTNLSLNLTNTELQKSPDWLIALASRIFFNIYDSEHFINMILKKLRKKVSEVEKPSFISDISIVDIYVGPELPLINSVRLISISNEGAVEAEASISYSGSFKISVEVSFKITLPGNRVIFIPATLSARIKKLAGRVHIHSDAPPAGYIWLGFYEEPDIQLDINTEIGENYKIRSIPRLASIIVNQLKKGIIENMLLPNMVDIPIPGISNPLKPIKPILKKTESEPLLHLNRAVAFSEDTPPQTHRQILEKIDEHLNEFVERESKKDL